MYEIQMQTIRPGVKGVQYIEVCKMPLYTRKSRRKN